jgi:amidophosphoribosyltransferase
VAHERDEQGVCDLLGADGLIYQSVEDMLQVKALNPKL